MKKWTRIPNEINGFVIIKDNGIINTKRSGIVECKVCKKYYETDLWKLHKRKSCGCLKPDQMGVLPHEINGFKIIKDLGYDGKRRALVICKICKRKYETQVWTLVKRKGCGCHRKKTFKCLFRKTHPRLVRIYIGMKARCYYVKDKYYKIYGGKGIKICKDWLINADKFCTWALDNGYTDKLTIDRINNKKGYSPKNCRWVTITEQLQNRSCNKITMKIAEEIRKKINTMSYKELAEYYNVSVGTINNIVNFKSWNKNGS